jgi:hypothetical protein
MQLYFHPQSPNCVKVLFGAELMGLSLEHAWMAAQPLTGAA